MTRIQTACFSLIASAFVLAGMLVMHLDSRAAFGEMVISEQDFAMMTARTRPDEEALFVLDNSTGRVLIYRTDIANDNIELLDNINLNRWLEQRQPRRQGGNNGS